jgi:hypothetical protein
MAYNDEVYFFFTGFLSDSLNFLYLRSLTILICYDFLVVRQSTRQYQEDGITKRMCILDNNIFL